MHVIVRQSLLVMSDDRESCIAGKLRWLEENRRRYDEAATYAYDMGDEEFYRVSLDRLADVKRQIAELKAREAKR